MCAHYMSVSADDGKCKAISPEVVVSVITPIHNAREFVEDVCKSVASQTFSGGMEWSIYDDASTDNSMEIVHSWLPRLKAKQVRVVIGGHSGKEPKGVGFAKNRAIQQSSGQFLCFMDAVLHTHLARTEFN
eukprot:m.128980 g.128980  ORF g.128980 m.128980 type:complete len:131 (+) comp37960_c0_seq10:62-454(+)